MKTKIRPYGNEATDIHDNEIPRVDSNYTCNVNRFCTQKRWKLLSASVFKRIQTHWKRKKNVIRYIIDDLVNSSDSDNSAKE